MHDVILNRSQGHYFLENIEITLVTLFTDGF